MGFLKKVFRPVRKIAKKIIPKEVKPFLPYIAASFGPVGAGTFSSGIKAALQRGLIAGATSAATDEEGNPLRAGILAATPGLISDTAQLGAVNAELAGMGKTANLLSRTSDFVKANEGLKTIGAQTAIDQGAKFAEIRQDELDEYNRSLREQGVLDKTKRRTAIFNIYKNAGYEDDYVNSMLDRYGYAKGGEVEEEMSEVSLSPGKGKMTEIEKTLYAMEEGGDKGIMSAKRKKRKKDDLAGGLMAAAQGVEKAFGRGFGNMEPVPMLRFAQGGRIGLASGGNFESYKDFIESTGDDELMDLYVDFLESGDFTKLGNALKRKGYAKGGEIEIEEETDDLGIMDFMRDQGIEYGEQASNIQNDEILQNLYEEFLDLGYSPKDAAKKAQEAFDDMSQKPGEGIMQMAKSDMQEMYEQYVFEMQEQGLTPMSFSEFLRQARSGMADGGKAKKVSYGFDDAMSESFTAFQEARKNGLIPPTMEFDEYLEIMREKMADGGDVMTADEYFKEKGKRNKFRNYEKMRKEYEEYKYKKKYGPRNEAKDGGIMEKDMRGGGFIPEGSKERADDVPARLSKNEFVMTADAVRAAGGGSVNKGAKRMYDMMYSLEGKI